MSNRIIVNGTTYQCPDTPKSPVLKIPSGREWRRLHIIATHAEAVGAFTDDVTITYEWDSVIDDDGNTEVLSQDLSEYCVAGEITDMRDGSVVVLMGKKTEMERLLAAAAAQGITL